MRWNILKNSRCKRIQDTGGFSALRMIRVVVGIMVSPDMSMTRNKHDQNPGTEWLIMKPLTEQVLPYLEITKIAIRLIIQTCDCEDVDVNVL